MTNKTLTAAAPLDDRRVVRRQSTAIYTRRVPSVEVLTPYLSAYWQEQNPPIRLQRPDRQRLPAERRDVGPPGCAGGAFRLGRRAAKRVATPCARCHSRLSMASSTAPMLWTACTTQMRRRPWPAPINDWIADEWLASEPRLRAALVVPSQYPELAAREIDRLGEPPWLCPGLAAGSLGRPLW